MFADWVHRPYFMDHIHQPHLPTISTNPCCHHFDFLVTFGTDLSFLNFFNFYFLMRLVTTPHVLHNHMTYVYSLSLCFICFHFTWSHGQEKSLLYYDLFDFWVLLHGHTPTLIFFFHYPTTPILTINVYHRRTNLQKDMGRPWYMMRSMATVRWRTRLTPDQTLSWSQWSFHQWSQYSWLSNVIRNPYQSRQGLAANSCQDR